MLQNVMINVVFVEKKSALIEFISTTPNYYCTVAVHYHETC